MDTSAYFDDIRYSLLRLKYLVPNMGPEELDSAQAYLAEVCSLLIETSGREGYLPVANLELDVEQLVAARKGSLPTSTSV